jgi:hypothetical protein
MAQPPPFEIPQQLRELAERNVEQARAAYGQFMDAMMQATGMWANAIPANAMTSGFKTVQDRAVRFAKQNAEACFAWRASWPTPRTSPTCWRSRAAMRRRRCRPMRLQAQELGRLMAEATQNMQPKG